ncbi:hypothetical protein BFP97_16395 [Roseivirga sp. 4D4]|uniref:outer membrane beta-barrel protein n=1 Tax=Roseivirga sp. 4D4 TaxID=1889784 RepID=UPI000852BCFE|nr:outer membrane beta-barrel protein [Roseivirga sp. 4D4]OEK03004.1 hypothetical protein BFP97_16395 [Roseivirga sp. 4D4]
MDEAKNGDRLEQLVREAAEGAQFEFNPSAWSAMEQKLDAPKKGFFWWKLWGGLGLLAIIVLLIIYIPGGAKEGETTSDSALTENAIQKDNPESTDQKNSESVNPEGDKADKSEKTLAEPQEGNEPNQEEKNTDTPSSEPANSATAAASRGITTDQNQVAETEVTTDKTSVKDKTSLNLRNSGQETALATTQSSADVSKINRSVSSVTTKQTEKSTSAVTYFDPEQPIGALDSIGEQQAQLYELGMETIAPRWVPSVFLFDLSLKPMTLDTSNYQTADLDSLQAFKRWSFGALVSLDLSATGLEGFTDPGTMIGLLAEYRFSRNWSIQSGLSYSVKNYSALGEEYDTSTWPGGRSDNLVSALARCLVIDIPINVRRYFAAKNGNQWFISTGLSTYLMLREDYEYEYTRPSPNWAPNGQVRGENNHFFGIANFSVGYETPINKKLGLAIEPFMKLPLTGIGQGRVKFLSFGANVAIKLR